MLTLGSALVACVICLAIGVLMGVVAMACCAMSRLQGYWGEE
jgi:hypothetical protein